MARALLLSLLCMTMVAAPVRAQQAIPSTGILQWPIPGPGKASSPKQCHAGDAYEGSDYKERGTQYAPLFVKAIPTDKSETEKANETRESQEKASTDWWLMVFTGAVAIFTAALVGATYFLYRTGEKQIGLIGEISERQAKEMQAQLAIAKGASDAAMLQAKAAIAVELPSLRLVSPTLTGPTRPDGTRLIPGGTDLPEWCCFICSLENAGRTQAELIMYSIEWDVVPVLVGDPEYKVAFPISPDTVIKQSELKKHFIQYKFQLQAGHIELIKNQKSYLWIFGNIKYFDFMGDLHEKRFCYKWLGVNAAQVPTGFIVDWMTPQPYVKGS